MSKAFVPIGRVDDNPHQSRLDVGDTEGLAVTILNHGLQSLPPARLVDESGEFAREDGTPLTMAPTSLLEENPEWRMQLAAGHRRKEAVALILDIYESGGVLGCEQVTDRRLKRAGLRPGHLPVEVKALTDSDMLDVLTIENAQREGLSPIEQARLIGELDAAGRSGQEIAERFGKSPSWVSNRKRLTELPTYVQEHVHEGDISVRQAQALVRAEAVADEAKEVFESYDRLNNDLKPGTMASLAADGAITSDGIRERTEALEGLIETKQNAETDQTDGDRPDGEETETDHDGDDVGAPQEDAAGAGDGGPGEVVSGHDEDLQGSQAGDGAEERDGAAGAAGRGVSGDGAPPETNLEVTDTGGEPGALGQIIAEVEREAMDWEVGSCGDTYFARVQDGGTMHEVTGAETPVRALQNVRDRALGRSPDVGTVDPDQVDVLLAPGEDMWDAGAAAAASIASLYVAYVVADKRMERWRREEIAQEMRSRQETVTEDDFPDDVWAKAQAEIRSRLEPQEA